MPTAKCYHHATQMAAAQCQACGKHICRDCSEIYGVSSGQYAGQSLCYDCTTQLVASNIKEVAKFRRTVKREFTAIIIGAAIGALMGFAIGGLFGLVVGFGAGGSIYLTLKVVGKFILEVMNPKPFGDSFTVLSGLALTIFLSPIATTRKIIDRTSQMKQADAILANDQRNLEAMRDYYAYTKFMEKYEGSADFVKQARKELSDNSYAKAIVDNGEEIAQTEVRERVIQVAANGEIIRSFKN